MERSRRRGRIGLNCRFELGARVSDGTRGGVSSDSGGGSSDAQRYCRQLRPRWGASGFGELMGCGIQRRRHRLEIVYTVAVLCCAER